MTESIHSARSIGQSSTSVSIEALEEIVRNCQRNEDRLHELERHTRHERRKAEQLLRETYRTMQEPNSETTSLIDNLTATDNSQDDRLTTNYKQSSKEFFVRLDDEEENENENENLHQRQSNHTNNNKSQRQDKHLLERVEKLLAGDGTTTTASSDVMSSQERQKKIEEKSTSTVDDDLDEKSLDIHQKTLPEPRQLPSACSIENELATVDRLLIERTPVNKQQPRKSNLHANQANPTKTKFDYNEEKKYLYDERDRQFYERLNNYVETGRFVSPELDKQMADDEIYQAKPRQPPKMSSKDDELADLARRCEDLLSRLHTQRTRAEILENSTHQYDYYRRATPPSSSSFESQSNYHHHHHRHRSLSPSPSPPPHPPPMSLQESLELLRPEFISRSRQRARRVRLLREEREHNTEIERERERMLLFSCSTCCTHPSKRTISSAPSRPTTTQRNISFIVPYEQSKPSRVLLSYRQMKQETKKKYEQLPEVKDRRLQNQMDEIRRRNVLRAKVFRTRLRQHVARHGRTNINESLTMIDT